MEKTIEQTYQKKSQLEHILLRPDSYIGSVEPVNCSAWVIDDESRLVQRDITYTPGLYKIFDEVLVNAADNKQRDKTMNKIEVTIDAATNSITVWNNGASIPVVMHAEEHMYVPELIFGHLLTSSNYDDDERKTTGGRNGYGAKLANIFSTRFEVEANDGERGLNFKQVYSTNMTVRDNPRVTKAKSVKSFTRVTFFPDLARFKMTALDSDTLALLKRRVYDMAGISDRSLKVVLNGSPVPVASFKDYVAMFQNGTPFVYERLNERWEIAVGVSNGQFVQVSFVNAISTTKGGRHVDAVVNLITAAVAEKASKKTKTAIKPFQVKNHMAVYVNCLVENPAFDSQTKDTLTTQAKFFGSKVEIGDALMKRVCKVGLVERVSAWSKFKETAELTKASGTKRVNLRGIPKLDDANWAGGAHSAKCTLILTEGDSAKTLAISGLSVVGRDRFGVFPLRGKLLNVRDCTQAKMMANAEIQALVDILGLKFGVEYTAENVKTLRYGSVMIMADQDHDGSHIKGLVINFIHAFWPSLVRLPGFLCEFITPIIKVSKSGTDPISFYTMPEYATWASAHPSGWVAKYYKGLGTSTSAEAKDYFGAISKHRIAFSYEGEDSDASIALAFDASKSDDRKLWLLSIEEGTHVNYNVASMPYTTFVNHELSLFSLADNVRSIPSVIDGLKPSQRKILFGCFKRNLTSEIKVAQLSGYVSEHAAYHHGEQSLNGTIINMAQTFVGSNNINLLYPSGQFGSRLMGGKDSASPRYIFSRLSHITRDIFNPHDDALLEYLVEEGVSIEPKHYIPVLPMVLVNGSSGIGTGWSTSIPPYNPSDLIAALRALLAGNPCPPLHPWFQGFVGTVSPKDDNKYVTSGVADLDATSGILTVTELPINTWTQDYKEFLESLLSNTKKTPAVASPIIESFSDESTDTSVCFKIKVAPAHVGKLAEDRAFLLKTFHLESSFTTTNMHMFDEHGKICKYDTPQQILETFFVIRRDFYVRRHAHLVAVLTLEWQRLDNKMRFVSMVVSRELIVTMPTADLLSRLRELDFMLFDADEYDYLLSIPIRGLTNERVEKLRNERDAKAAELDILKSRTPDDLWQMDLMAIESKLSHVLSDVAPAKKRTLSTITASSRKKACL